MDKWLKTGTLQRKTSASTTEIRTTDLAAMELTWISKMIIMKCKGRLIDLFSCGVTNRLHASQKPRLDNPERIRCSALLPGYAKRVYSWCSIMYP
ncbi:hypothetical protein AVEN_66178-1 [Araneus ventricosus]|uniref:Uncharacterized protein n=1 Tax=Araneus ventricosus TaxID=182803 RepID=A0A4Y2P0J2_ARAVE|nr:hypothetical protein AVEN_66178-1 [Araneus ventricosus]